MMIALSDAVSDPVSGTEFSRNILVDCVELDRSQRRAKGQVSLYPTTCDYVRQLDRFEIKVFGF